MNQHIKFFIALIILSTIFVTTGAYFDIGTELSFWERSYIVFTSMAAYAWSMAIAYHK